MRPLSTRVELDSEKGLNAYAVAVMGRCSNERSARTPLMGFSLIELMVALTIFSIVMTISLGTLLTLIDANNKAQALSSAMTNLSFALDSISRSLRTGSEFYCSMSGNISDSDSQMNNLHSNPYNGTHDCSGGEAIVFTPGLDSSLRTAYRLDNNQIEQWVDANSGDPDGWVPITSNTPPGAVTVNALSFSVSGTDAVSDGDEVQPKITISIDGEVDSGLTNTTSFSIQTTVTQRILNY